MKPITRTQGQRLMCKGYADVLRAIVNGATGIDVSEQADLGRMSAQKTVNRLCDAGLIHESEWTQRLVSKRMQWMPIYRFGPGGALPDWPGEGLRKPRARGPVPVELLTFINAVKALQLESYNRKGLAEVTGLNPRTAGDLIRRLHELRLIFIDDYDQRPNGSYGYPTYTWGVNQKDRVKPAPIPKPVLWERWNKERAARKKTAHLLGLIQGPGHHKLHEAITPATNAGTFTRAA